MPNSPKHFPAPEWTALSAQMAATLAHEIRNPLLAIRGAAQLLAQAAQVEDKPLAELIVAETRRIDQLIATLDPLTPDPQHAKDRLNIHEITEYVRLAARSLDGSVQFVTDYDPSLPEVAVGREALIQALLNVVKNASEAVRGTPNARVTMTTRYLVGERLQRAGGGRKLPIVISVTDNGPGVAESVIPRLFTPFTTDKADGKGLGLAIAAKIVEEHEGLIAHDRPAAGGARFTFYLPAAQ